MRALAMVTLVAMLACSTQQSPKDNLVDELPIVDDEMVVVAPSTELRSRLIVLRPKLPPVYLSAPRSIAQLSRLDLRAATTARPDDLAAAPTAPQKQLTRSTDDALLLPARHQLPARVAAIELAPMASDPGTSGSPALVFATRGARALDLVEVLQSSDSLIAVRHRGDLRLLAGRSHIPGNREPDGLWIEVRIDAEGADIEVIPGKPVRVRRDVAAIAQAVRNLMPAHAHHTGSVDVLVAPDVEAAELVGVLAALRVASPQVALGVGAFPDERQQSLRGWSIPRLHIRANHRGDHTALHNAITSHGRALLACYLAEAPRGVRPEMRTLTLRWAADRVGPSIVSGDAPASQCMRDVLSMAGLPGPLPFDLNIEMRPDAWQ